MATTFYDVSNMKAKNQKSDPFAAFEKQPTEPKKDENEMYSSKGFKIEDSEFKQGSTLDKVLGGGFKKIDIFSNNFRGANDLFPSGAIADEGDRSSEDGGYENFEIAEIESEEELNNENNGVPGRKQSRKRGRAPAAHQYEQLDTHDEIREKINKKYKHKVLKSKNKYIRAFRSPEPFAQEFNDFSKAIDDGSVKSNRTNKDAEDYEEMNSNPYKQKHTGNNFTRQAFIVKEMESRSLSPSERNDFERGRETFKGSFYDEKRNTKGNFGAQQNVSRQGFYQGPNDNHNQFRTSKTMFRKTINEDHSRDTSLEERKNRMTIRSKFDMNDEITTKMRTSGMKASFVSAYGVDSERDKIQKSQYMHGSETTKMRDTGTRFHMGISGLQKNPFENNRIAERIKQHEQEMLDKYSNKRLIGQDDRKNLCVIAIAKCFLRL